MDITLEKSLFRACSILFGSEISVNRDFLFYIELQGVKGAFRRKALMTHPDRFILPGINNNSASDFIEAAEAYKQLVNFIDSREKNGYLSSSLRRNSTHSQRSDMPHGKGVHRDRYYSGSMPRRPLLFAEYLYYSGIITWSSLIQAVVWQRQLRPHFGKIACGWRYLSEKQIQVIIKNKKISEKIGCAAVRMNFLNQFQVYVILRHQMNSQRPIGNYFVDTGVFTEERLCELLSRFRYHKVASKVKRPQYQ